jgi:hypothetical protein
METYGWLKRALRLERHVEKAQKTNRLERRKNLQLMKVHPSDKKILLSSNRLLDHNWLSLQLQKLTVLNVQMAMVYLMDLSMLLNERSSSALKGVARVEKHDRNVFVQTPKKYFKVLETLRREIELRQKAASQYIN